MTDGQRVSRFPKLRLAVEATIDAATSSGFEVGAGDRRTADTRDILGPLSKTSAVVLRSPSMNATEDQSTR